MTSNRAPSDWYPLFPNPVVAKSLLDRLINTSHQVIMNGPSYRPTSGPGTRPTRRPRVRPSRLPTPTSQRHELACQRHRLACGPWEIQADH
ncbi:ATP-binding protein [Streptomyces phaeofaciens]